jgi:hypothetical protein
MFSWMANPIISARAPGIKLAAPHSAQYVKNRSPKKAAGGGSARERRAGWSEGYPIPAAELDHRGALNPQRTGICGTAASRGTPAVLVCESVISASRAQNRMLHPISESRSGDNVSRKAVQAEGGHLGHCQKLLLLRTDRLRQAVLDPRGIHYSPLPPARMAPVRRCERCHTAASLSVLLRFAI